MTYEQIQHPSELKIVKNIIKPIFKKHFHDKEILNKSIWSQCSQISYRTASMSKQDQIKACFSYKSGPKQDPSTLKIGPQANYVPCFTAKNNCNVESADLLKNNKLITEGRATVQVLHRAGNYTFRFDLKKSDFGPKSY